MAVSVPVLPKASVAVTVNVYVPAAKALFASISHEVQFELLDVVNSDDGIDLDSEEE